MALFSPERATMGQTTLRIYDDETMTKLRRTESIGGRELDLLIRFDLPKHFHLCNLAHLIQHSATLTGM
jgi:hypothetical protein